MARRRNAGRLNAFAERALARGGWLADVLKGEAVVGVKVVLVGPVKGVPAAVNADVNLLFFLDVKCLLRVDLIPVPWDPAKGWRRTGTRQ